MANEKLTRKQQKQWLREQEQDQEQGVGEGEWQKQEQEQEQEHEKEQGEGQVQENMLPTTIRITKLPEGVSASDVEKMFSKQGMVATVRIQDDGDGCFVTYTPIDKIHQQTTQTQTRTRSKTITDSPSMLREHRTPSPSPSRNSKGGNGSGSGNGSGNERGREERRTRLKLNGKATRVHMRLALGPPTEGPMEVLRGFSRR